MKRFLFLLILVSIFPVACNSRTQIQTIEVTRVVQEPEIRVVTVEVTRQFEVTRQVEVTRVIQKEVTRVVSVRPTPSPTPKEIDPSSLSEK